jgi:hypothetical protein
MTTLCARFVGIAAVLIVELGCAARFEGELDGEALPSLQTAAYALVDGPGTSVGVVGHASRGDACAESTELARILHDQAEATTATRINEVTDRLVKWYTRAAPEGTWLVQLQVQAPGAAVLRDLSVAVGSPDTDADVVLSACRSEGNPRALNGVFVPDLDCSFARGGRLDVALDDDVGSLRLQSIEEGLPFVDVNGRVDGTLRLDMTFTACDSLAAVLADPPLVSGGEGAGEGEGEGEPCRQDCFVDQFGQERCETICPP